MCEGRVSVGQAEMKGDQSAKTNRRRDHAKEMAMNVIGLSLLLAGAKEVQKAKCAR